MKFSPFKTKNDHLLIAEIMETEIEKHHLYHLHLCNFITILQLLTVDKAATGLPELKEAMRIHWTDFHGHLSENKRLLLWAFHFRISRMLVKQHRKHNMQACDVTGGYGSRPLNNLQDINDYYAFAGVVLLALKEADVAAIMECTAHKLSKRVEQQVPLYYKNYKTM